MKLTPTQPTRPQVVDFLKKNTAEIVSAEHLKALLDKGVTLEWVDTFSQKSSGKLAVMKQGDEVFFVREADAKSTFGALQAAREHTLGGIFGTEPPSSQTKARVIAALSDPNPKQGFDVDALDIVRGAAAAELARSGRLDEGFFEGVAAVQKQGVRQFPPDKLGELLGRLKSDFTTSPPGWDEQAGRTFTVLADRYLGPTVFNSDLRQVAANELVATGQLGEGFFIGVELARDFGRREFEGNSGETIEQLRKEHTGSPPSGWDAQASRTFARLTDPRSRPVVSAAELRSVATAELAYSGKLAEGFVAGVLLANRIGVRDFKFDPNWVLRELTTAADYLLDGSRS